MAKVEVVLIGALARIAGEKKVEVEASTLHGARETLAGRWGEEFRDRLFDDLGSLRRFVNVYVNGRDVRFLNKLETPLNEGDSISLIPAASGG